MSPSSAALIPSARAPGAVLDARALNRALLERQLLLHRHATPVSIAVEQLVGLQAQVPSAPYFALWARISGFCPADLDALIEQRAAVRTALMRWTLHLVGATDFHVLRPLVQPVLDRRLRARFGRELDGVNLERLAAAGRALLGEEPRTATELGRLLGRRWPGRERSALAHAVAVTVPLVQIPPRGLWQRHGRALQLPADTWLGQAPGTPPATIEDLVARYLAAFGPATASDLKTWSGLTGFGEVLAQMRPRLRTFRDAHGRELFDVPGGPLPDPDTPAPPRLLTQYDNVLLAHADRSRIVTEAHRKRIAGHRTVLVDGFVRGIWKIVLRPDVAILAIRPIEPIDRDDAIAVAREARRLLRFAAADRARHEVRFI